MMKNKMKIAMKIFIYCILTALTLSGCMNNLLDTDYSGNGNVTVTVGTNNARTLYPNGISVFNRIEIIFTKDSASAVLNIPSGQSSGSINLENGTWSISAKGFIEIDSREYEAAQANTSCTVSGATSVPIVLQTGILNGSPGVFKFNIGLLSNVDDALLDINPLIDPYGNINTNYGRTRPLKSSPSGSFDLLPGYYLLTLTARIGNTMAVWNEVVHIYSGQETIANHTFAAGDFTGAVSLSGVLLGGEFNGEHLQEVELIAYGDINYLTRVASVKVPLSRASGEVWYTGNWEITVPSSLIGKTLYLIADETLIGGPSGTRNYIRYLGSDNHITVTAEGITGHKIGLEYYWWAAASSDLSSDSITSSMSPDGIITVTTTQTTIYEWQYWWHTLGLSYPAENNITYTYEFDAWTDSGTRTLKVIYINKWNWNETQLYKDFTIDTTRKTYTIVSTTPFDSNATQYLEFQCGSTSTGVFHVKMNSIQRVQDYVPPQPEGGRWRADATPNGIKFIINMTDLPEYINTLVIRNLTNGSLFAADLDRENPLPNEYQVVFPYVAAGKEYNFSLGSYGYPLADNITVTATGGRGELGFSNAANLLLIKEGNFVKFNPPPALSVNEAKAVNARYTYEFATGTSWNDPAAKWQISVDKTNSSEAVDLLDTNNFPGWANPAAVLASLAGKTSFAGAFYTFDYENSDIYPTNSKRGFFRTDEITSAPFTYPRVLTNVFTAEPCAEGVKFIVDLTKIPPGASSLQFHSPDWNMQCYIGRGEWENEDAPFYGSDTVEIVYPFVNAGTKYNFGVSIGSTGLTAEADEVTATAGLGEVKYTGSPSLIYTPKNKTMTFNGVTRPVIGSSSKIERQGWEWQFYLGHNWSDGSWISNKFYDNLQSSIVFDETFTDVFITNALSGKSAYIQVFYNIRYDGHDYQFHGIVSPPFTFPSYDPVGIVNTHIISAFETNNCLYINYYQDNTFINISVDDYNWYEGDYPPDKYYWFYIDGNLKDEGNENGAYLQIGDLSSGKHYGLAVVSIDGAIFAKEFEIWK